MAFLEKISSSPTLTSKIPPDFFSSLESTPNRRLRDAAKLAARGS